MEYFKLLELDREPFSNSPDPDFFFESAMHVQCLQQLEMALRLKRGLSVVLGPVGTGKTTICRQLLRRCGHDAKITTHLLLDPSFESPRRFLEHLVREMVLAGAGEAEAAAAGDAADPWQLKERLKNHLFREGVERRRTTLLIIDEGQKLSRDNLELLRELLNYETNESKLLQIIIFAQEEFADHLEAMPNLRDRVNLLYHLNPLSFAETREMVRFRLAEAHPEGAPPVRFTWLALWRIHRASGGFPRQIIHLCHKVIMTLIIQGQTKAGWRLVGFAARGGRQPARAGMALPALAGLVLLVLLAGAGMVFRSDLAAFLTTGPEGPRQVAPEQKMGSDTNFETKLVSDPNFHPNFPAAPTDPVDPVDLADPAEPPPAGSGPVQRLIAVEPDKQPLLGEITVREHDTLSWMLHRIFGVEQPGRLNELLTATQQFNPGLADLNRIISGQRLRFSHPGPGYDPAPGYWLELARKADLDQAFAFLRRHEQSVPLRLALAADPAGNAVYPVLVNQPYQGLLEAEAALEAWEGNGPRPEITVFTKKAVATARP